MATPKVGDDIYLQSRWFNDRGEDDVQGGLAEVTKVDVTDYGVFVTTKEVPGTSYNWIVLEEEQEDLKKSFGDARAYPDPDFG